MSNPTDEQVAAIVAPIDDSVILEETITFVPSKYQEAIFEFVQNGRGDGVVSAVAGSGKTTTLVEAAKFIKSDRAIFCAFNKHIAEMLNVKLAGTTMQAKTIHAIGNGMLYSAFGKTQIQNNKYNKLAKMWCDRHKVIIEDFDVQVTEAIKSLTKLVNMARLTLTDITDVGAMSLLAMDYQIENYEVVLSGVSWVLSEGLKQAEYGKIIDFTDMIWIPNRMDLKPSPVDWVFTDECQDLSAAQLETVLRLRAPGGRMLFCGDRKQAIMGFAGADCYSFDKIKERTEAIELPLSINYRCPTSHLDEARKIVPQIEARPNAPVGVYETIKQSDLLSQAREGDLILCRCTAPLIKWCIKFIEQKISARVRGRDVGKDLTDLARGIASNESHFVYGEFGRILDDYEHKQVHRLMQKEGNEGRIESLRDRLEALNVCWQSFHTCNTLDELCQEIEGLFSDDRSSIWLSTVHRAKGLEEKRVFIIEPDKLPLKWKNQTPEQAEQEMNLRYVALTRSLAELYLVQS